MEFVLNIAICDDNPSDRNAVAFALRQYMSKKSVAYQIDPFPCAQDFIAEVKGGNPYDIVFLDIYMGGLLGIDAAVILRQMDYGGKIVFYTASKEFAVAGYEVEASGYLLKPLNHEKLFALMDRILCKSDIDSYRIQRRCHILNIPYNDILYVESSNSKCILHTVSSKEYNVYKKLDNIQQELKDSRFLRTHRSFLVNMNHIRRVSANYFMLFSGEGIPIRQRESHKIHMEYDRYCNAKNINKSL